MKNLRHLLRRVNPTKSRQPSEVRSRGPLSKKRRLLSESLEQRQLLAADVGVDTADSGVEYTDVDDYSIAHNYWNKFDVNSDGFVTALDALRVINFMNESGEGEPTGTSVEYAGFVDVNADHMVTSLDALQVINQLNSEGEGAEDYDVRFELTPRNLDDSLITQTGTYDIPGVGTGIEYTVDEGDIFKLEVAVQDDRGRGLSFGVFQAVTDIIIDQTDVLAPAVGEIQGFNFDRTIVSEGSTPNSSIEFYFADDTSTTVSGSISEFLGASDSDTAEYISDAIVELSSLRSDLDISAEDIDSSFFTTSTTSPYFSRIEYNGLDLVLDDIPRLETRLILDGVEVPVTTIEENVMVNGEFNPNTLVSRYETFMRNAGQNDPVDPNNNDGLGPLIYGQDRNIGSFDTDVNGTDIFDEVGTLGPVGNLTAIIEDFTFTTAYDAFSIPVIAISAASDVGVKLDQVEPREGFEGVLIYGTDNGKEGVDPDRVRLDERSEFQLNVIGAQTGITASNASLSVEEDDADGESVDLTVNASSGETPTYAVTNQTTDLGTVSISSTGEFTYVPDADAFGTDLVTFTATTPTDGTATATVTVTIAAVNDAPVANDDSGISVEVGNSVNISVLANDDAGGNFSEPLSELSISLGSTAPTLGSVQVVNDQIVYTPTLGVASSTDTFTYTVSDGEFTSNEATVTVSVINNQVGVSAGDKSITIDEDNGGATTSAALIADLDGADASLITVNTGTGFTLNSATLTAGSGTVSFDDNTNEIFYTPAQDFNGTAEITYNASNSEGGDDGVITVTVTPINDAPVATDLDFNINEGATMTYNVLSPGSQTGPSDVETPTANLTVNVASQPTAFGTVSVVNNQIVVESTGTFDDGGFSFTYNVTDADGAVSNSGVIDINVLNVQDAPVASNSTQPAVDEGVQTLSVDLGDLTTVENDVDLTYTIETLPSFGSASISNDTLMFTLDADENGTATVVYRAAVTGNSSLFDTGTITFTVNSVNDAPVLGSIANQTVPEFSSIDIDVLAQASDVDDATNTLDIEIVTDGAKGTATVVDGIVRYQHDTTDLGADTIEVLVRDPGGLASATQTININITDVVLAPVASDGSLSATEDGDDVDLDLAPLVNAQAGAVTFTFTQPSDGSASVTNGVLTYTPDADFFGQTSMTYTATNALGSDTGTITINVTGTNDAPIAVADSVEAIKNVAIEIDVLSNDTPNPGGESDTITVTVESGDEPTNGTVSITNNIITYTPNTDFSGTDSFTYTVDDGEGGTDTALVSIDVKDFIPSEVTGQLYLDSITNMSDVINNGAAPMRNGQYDQGETTLAGVRVLLNEVGGAAGSSRTAVTDTSGRYTFTNIPPGSYEIVYDLPPGMQVSGPGATGVIPVFIPAAGGLVGDTAAQGNFTIESLGTYITSGRNIVSTQPGTDDPDFDVTPGEISTFFFTEDTVLVDGTEVDILDQNTVLVGRDFGDAEFVELLINEDRDEALLVVVQEGDVMSAVVSKDRFALTDRGSDVAVDLLGGLNDFTFSDVDDITDITDNYPAYEDAVDELFGSM